MKSRNYLRAKVLTLIPLIVLVVTVICIVLATILEEKKRRSVLYTIFAFAGLMGVFISPLPCLVLSIIGTVFAAKAAKEGFWDKVPLINFITTDKKIIRMLERIGKIYNTVLTDDSIKRIIAS